MLASFLFVFAGAAAAQVTTSSLGTRSPTFVGPAATGCRHDCSLLSGPFLSPAISPNALASVAASAVTAAPLASASLVLAPSPLKDSQTMPAHQLPRKGPDPAPPTVNCQPLGPGCDRISSSSGGAIGAKGLNAVDNGNVLTSLGAPFHNNEPADQGLCAGNGYVVETNNVGEILIFNA